MIVFLLILMGLGIVLSLFLLFSPEDSTAKNQKYFQGVVVGELRQLKEQVTSLSSQVKHLGAKQALTNSELFKLKEKGDFSLETEALTDEYVEVDKLIKLNNENDGLRQQVTDLSLFSEENKNLAKKVTELTFQTIKFKDMYKQQEKLIYHLQENENNLRQELEAAKRRELRLAQNLNKQEELCANLERELESIRAHN